MARYAKIIGLFALLLAGATAAPASPYIPPPPRPDYTPPPKPTDAVLYRRIFARQEAGDMMQADRLIAQLDDRLLMGYVLFQRYMHPTAYRAQWHELRDWLARYSDHPEAERVYRLALRRRPSQRVAPQAPTPPEKEVFASPYEGLFTSRASQRVKRYVNRLIARERPTQALRYIEKKTRRLSAQELAQLRAAIARSYYVEGKFDKAFEQARLAARQRDTINIADWHAGLAAWRGGKTTLAIRHFKKLAANPLAETRLIAMGAFWAARGLRQLGQLAEAQDYLELAAASGAHFYAFLANQQIAGKIAINWLEPKTAKDSKVLTRLPVRRGLTLAAAKRPEWGEQEILNILPKLTQAEQHALLPHIRKLDFAGVEYSIGHALQIRFGGAGQFADARQLVSGKRTRKRNLYRAFYPTPAFGAYFNSKPHYIGRALAYATIRQESRFRPRAKSRAGARGLMQIMPATAAFITGDSRLRRKNGHAKLFTKRVNIAIGNRYFRKLLAADQYGGNLIYTLAGYNAGPGNVTKWQRELREVNDPLLFLESIPITETRIYVRRVMENLWIYRTLLGQEAVTLRLLAADTWPHHSAHHETALLNLQN